MRKGNPATRGLSLRRLVLLLFLMVGGVSAMADVPRIFIVQLTENPTQYPQYSSLVLDSYVAEALDEIGQVDPLVWSMSDAKFRKIRDERGFSADWEAPRQDLIVPVAKAVGADYTLVVWSNRFGPVVRPIATLYRGAGGKKIWSYGDWDRRMAPFFDGSTAPVRNTRSNDPFVGSAQEFSAVEVGTDLDWDSTSRTIARTWAWQMKDGPFAKLPATPRTRLNPPDPGFTVPLENGLQLEPVTLDQIEDFVRNGRREVAIVYLRDLIDQFPYDEVPRRRLAELLFDSGFYEEAASEAKRAAKIAKEPGPMFVLAAECYLRIRQLDDARQSLNQARAFGLDGRDVSLLSGRISLHGGDFEKAGEDFRAAIRQGPTPKTVFYLALTDAIAGDAEGCRNNLAALVDHDADGLGDAYPEAMNLAAEMLGQIGARLREDIPRMRKNPGPEFVSLCAVALARTQGLAAFIELIPVPHQFAESHAARVLAHNLMTKAASEAFEFARNGREANATEATMNLGEAMRILPRVKDLFDFERNGQS